MKIPKKFLVKGSEEYMHPCPASGFLTLHENCGMYEIFQSRGWKDDELQLFLLDYQGGAYGPCMIDWQKELLEDHPPEQEAWGDWQRASGWSRSSRRMWNEVRNWRRSS